MILWLDALLRIDLLDRVRSKVGQTQAAGKNGQLPNYLIEIDLPRLAAYYARSMRT